LCPNSFVLQLISLAGLHSTALTTSELATAFKTNGMQAYVELIQRREKELGVDVLKHQKWFVPRLETLFSSPIRSGGPCGWVMMTFLLCINSCAQERLRLHRPSLAR
jgi:isocitrate lyase